MKKPISILTATALTLLLSACGVSSDSPAASGTTTKDAASTLELWHIHTADSRKIPIENAVARFEEANNVTVTISILENDPYKTKLKTVMGSGDEPDVFHSWGGGWLESFVKEDLVYDITKDVTTYADKLSPEAVGMNTVDGKIWGAPIFNSSTMIYYNKTIFAQYGLQPPKTYDELMTVCQTLVDNNVYPFALGNKSKWPGAQHFVLLSMRLGGADIFQRAMKGEITFEDPSFIKAGEMIIDMVDKGYFPEGVNGINFDTGGSRMMFYTGQCAMMLQTSGALSSVLSEAPEFYEKDLGLALYPAITGGKGKATDILAGENAFSVSAASQNKEMAAKLVEFLATDETLQQEIADNGTLPALQGIVPKDPIVKEASDQLSEATFLQNFIDQTLSPSLAEKHKDTVQALFGKTLTPAQAAKEMQTAFETET